MTETDHSPTVRLRRLGQELRRLREETGLTIRDAAAQLEWSAAKISRIESGHTKRVDAVNVKALCGIYGVTDQETIGGLVKLAREARQRGWWNAYRDLFPGAYVGLEAEASSIRNFELAIIPGLLQTPEYAAEIVRTAGVREPDEIERRVAARIKRQQLLSQANPPQFWAVIDEAALLRPPGSREAHETQLRRLLDTNPSRHVTIQVLPMSVGLHAGLGGSFVILDFAHTADRSVVFAETRTDGLYLEEPEELQSYNLAFQHLCASALSVDASIAYLSDLIDKL
ncbi:helix-turn-helix domain-containing protein [Spongiactinospora rosea]|uniref:helix-turn-helix domain-containing protein n=1 Tax=Spongiactinospora rosea TaxID=2248750 RepID=UPI001CECAB2D|nr:helix-turn-helix transcriptional regulator [Spongiactinospora rosea]